MRAASTRAMSPRAGRRAFPPPSPPPLPSSAPATHPPPSATIARTQAKIYREEDNQQELFRILMAYCSLVVETMGKHRDWRSQKHAKRCRAYEAEVLRCMDEMERIKPIINAEAETYRMRLPEAPRVRPPPVHADPLPRAGLELATSTTEATPSPLERFTEGEWDLLSASPAQLAEAAERRGQTASSSSAAAAVSAPIPPRYVPRGEYTAERASGGAASKHSLLGMSLRPRPRSRPERRHPCRHPRRHRTLRWIARARRRPRFARISRRVRRRRPTLILPPRARPPRLLPHHLRPDRLNRRRRRGRIQDVSHRRRRAHRRRRRRRFPRVSSSPGKWWRPRRRAISGRNA